MDSSRKPGGITADPSCPPAPPAPAPRRHGHAGMDLTTGPLGRTLLVFSLPIVLQMSIQPLFGIVDRIFIGHLGPEAFNAVTNAGVLMMLVINLSAGLANGVTSYVARLVGKGDYREADNAAVHSMIIMLLFSALFIAVFYPFDRAFFRMLGMQPGALELAHQFIEVIVIGNLTIMFSLVGANVLRGEGDSRTPLTLAIISVGVNVVIAPVLIFNPEDSLFGFRPGWLGMGVAGGSWATVIGRGVGCALLIAYLLRGRNVWTFTLKNFRWDPRHIVEILRVGLPMLLVNLTSTLASLVFLRVLNENPTAVVAYGIGTQLDMIAILPMIGLAMGVVSMVGQNFGAGRLERARRASWLGGVYAAGFSGVMGIAAIAFPDFWVGLFDPTGDPEIRRLSVQYIYIVGLSYAFVAQVFVLGGAFQGLGKGMPSLITTVTRFILVAIPLVIILSPKIGPSGAFIAAAASHVVGGLMAIVWLAIEFRRIRRKEEQKCAVDVNG